MANTLLKSAALLAVVTLAGRLIGLLRNILLTNEFGVGVETDAFLWAITIPTALLMVITGALNSVLIPTLQKYGGNTAENEARRNQLYHRTLTIAVILCLALGLASVIFANPLVKLLAPGFKGDTHALAADLFAIMMVAVVFIGTVSVFSSVLNAHHEFFSPSLGTLLSGVAVIVAIYTVGTSYGMRGIAWGVTIGYALFAIYLLPSMRRKGYNLKFDWNWRGDRDLRSMGERIFPVMLGSAVSQAYWIIEKLLASGLGDQKITTLGLANGIIQVPIGLFAGALAVPLFPLLSEYVRQQRMDDMKSVLGKGFLYQYHVLAPATVGLIMLSDEFVRIFYAHGDNFSDEAVRLTAWAMIFYAVGMIGWAGRDLLVRAFYAVEDTRTPVRTGAIGLVLYVPLGLLLTPLLDHGGLALAYSIATYSTMLLLGLILKRRIGRVFTRSFYTSLLKGALASVVMAGVLWLVREAVQGWPLVVMLIVTVSVSAVVYGGMLVLLREPVFRELLDMLLRRVRRRG